MTFIALPHGIGPSLILFRISLGFMVLISLALLLLNFLDHNLSTIYSVCLSLTSSPTYSLHSYVADCEICHILFDRPSISHHRISFFSHLSIVGYTSDIYLLLKSRSLPDIFLIIYFILNENFLINIICTITLFYYFILLF